MNAYAANTGPGRCRQGFRGFSLVELLVVIAIIALLATMIIPSFARARELTRRATCGTKMRHICDAVNNYAVAGRYHRGTMGQAMPTNGPTTGNWGDTTSGNLGGLWLLVRYDFLDSAGTFLCPGAESKMDFTAPDVLNADNAGSGFGEKTCSYSYLSQVPFDGYEATSLTAVPSDMIVLADKNPRTTQGTQNIDSSENGKNSKAHGREGQNVGGLDSSVRFIEETTINDDDIYKSNGGNDSQGVRGDMEDIYLIP